MMSSDGYDGTVEVLGWSCFTTVPTNVANEAVRTLPDATMAKEELKTTGAAVVEAAVVAATGGLPGVHVTSLQESGATTFRYNSTYAYGPTPKYVLEGRGMAPSLSLMLGGIYIFEPIMNVDGQQHPLRLSLNPDGTHMKGGTMYKDFVQMGTNNMTLILTATCQVPSTLYYYSPTHKGLGNMISLAGGA